MAIESRVHNIKSKKNPHTVFITRIKDIPMKTILKSVFAIVLLVLSTETLRTQDNPSARMSGSMRACSGCYTCKCSPDCKCPGAAVLSVDATAKSFTLKLKGKTTLTLDGSQLPSLPTVGQKVKVEYTKVNDVATAQTLVVTSKPKATTTQ